MSADLLYQTKASQSSYRDTQHQIMLERSHLSQIEQRDRAELEFGAMGEL